jgi:hypothetical protein
MEQGGQQTAQAQGCQGGGSQLLLGPASNHDCAMQRTRRRLPVSTPAAPRLMSSAPTRSELNHPHILSACACTNIDPSHLYDPTAQTATSNHPPALPPPLPHSHPLD